MTNSTLPRTAAEVHILAVLINSSFVAKDVEFIGGPNHLHGGRRYVRIGYWQRLDESVYNEIKHYVTEELVDDDPEKLPEFAYFFNNQ